MRKTIWRSLKVFIPSCLLLTAAAHAQQPTATPTPMVAPPGFTMPAEPPRGWGAEQWTAMRNSCIRTAQKILAGQPLTPDDLSDREVCMTYGAGLGDGSGGGPVNPPLPPLNPQPTAMRLPARHPPIFRAAAGSCRVRNHSHHGRPRRSIVPIGHSRAVSFNTIVSCGYVVVPDCCRNCVGPRTPVHPTLA